MQIVNHCSFSEIYNKCSVSHFPLPCIFDIIRHCSSEKKPIKTQNLIKPKKPTRVGLLKNRVFLNPECLWTKCVTYLRNWACCGSVWQVWIEFNALVDREPMKMLKDGGWMGATSCHWVFVWVYVCMSVCLSVYLCDRRRWLKLSGHVMKIQQQSNISRQQRLHPRITQALQLSVESRCLMETRSTFRYRFLYSSLFISKVQFSSQLCVQVLVRDSTVVSRRRARVHGWFQGPEMPLICFLTVSECPSYTAVHRPWSGIPCCCCPYLEQSVPTCHVHTLYDCFPRSPQGFPLQDLFFLLTLFIVTVLNAY